MIPSGCVLSYLIRSYHIWSVYAALFSCLEQISNWDILKSTEFHCRATGLKRGEGPSLDDAFGSSIFPVLGVFRGDFCLPWKLSGFCLFLSGFCFNPWNGITISLLGPRPNRADHSQSRLSGGLYFQVKQAPRLTWSVRCLRKYKTSQGAQVSYMSIHVQSVIYLCVSVPCSQFDARFLDGKKHRVFLPSPWWINPE